MTFFKIEYFDPEFFLQTTFLLVVSNFASDICQRALMRAQFNIESPKTRGARIWTSQKIFFFLKIEYFPPELKKSFCDFRRLTHKFQTSKIACWQKSDARFETTGKNGVCRKNSGWKYSILKKVIFFYFHHRRAPRVFRLSVLNYTRIESRWQKFDVKFETASKNVVCRKNSGGKYSTLKKVICAMFRCARAMIFVNCARLRRVGRISMPGPNSQQKVTLGNWNSGVELKYFEKSVFF